MLTAEDASSTYEGWFNVHHLSFLHKKKEKRRKHVYYTAEINHRNK